MQKYYVTYYVGYETADGIKSFYFTFHKTIRYIRNDEYDEHNEDILEMMSMMSIMKIY